MFPPTAPHQLLSIILLSTTLTSILALSPPHLAPRQATSFLTCNQDNQLRALERFSTQASTFCPTYLAATTTAAANAALPTYVADFQGPDISSACECFQASATDTAVVLTLSATSAPTSSTSIPAVTVTASSKPSEQNAELSAGAKAGIGIACAVVGLAIMLGVAILFRKRIPSRRKAGSRSKQLGSISQLEDDGGNGAVGPPAYDAVEKDAGGYNHEVEAGNRFELRGDKTGGGG